MIQALVCLFIVALAVAMLEFFSLLIYGESFLFGGKKK